MALSDELTSEVKSFLISEWNTRKGTVVPEADSIQLGNDAVTFEEVAVLYADLAGSTALVTGHKEWFAAEVYKSFLHCASRIIKANNGVVTAFDGDRVMAVFIGDAKRSNATITALKIKGAVQEIINPAIKARYSTEYQINHAVGVDLSKAFVARTGVRGSNDLVWIGPAPNIAAKMSDIREPYYHSYITAAVYDRLREDAKLGGSDNTDMWESWWWAGGQATIYRSHWRWTP